MGFLYDEKNLIVERQNAALITQAQLLQMAYASIHTKPAGKAFRDLITVLNLAAVPEAEKKKDAPNGPTRR